MTAENGKVSAPSPLARRLLEDALGGPEATIADYLLGHHEALQVLPSGSARIAVVQSMAIAAKAITLLAEEQGRDRLAVLAEMWPEREGST